MTPFLHRRVFVRLLVWLLAIVGVNSLTIHRRAVIDHDKVVGFSQTVPSGTTGASYLKFKPWLKVTNGCVPFPAVDASGNTSGGLATSGSPESGCSSSTGQVYVRSAWHGSRFAIMYAWYFPKDSPSAGLGHRHDWEGIVVWIDDPATSSPQILGVSTSAHGGFSTVTPPNIPLDGTRPKIEYFSTWPLDHQLGVTSTKGGEQPLIAWESMTDAARTALTNTDFGDANVPFKDSNFSNNLDKASF